jgi:hypothetical protein
MEMVEEKRSSPLGKRKRGACGDRLLLKKQIFT